MNEFERIAWTEHDTDLISNLRNLDFANGWSTAHPEVVAYRARLLALQGSRCAYCRGPIESVANGYQELDHILPKSPRGRSLERARSNEYVDRGVTQGYAHFMYEPMNIVLSCKQCNTAKGNFDPCADRDVGPPEQFPSVEQVHWYNAHFHAYHDHIEKNADCVFIPKTIQGDYTIRACKLDDVTELAKRFRARAFSTVALMPNLLLKLNVLAANVQAGIHTVADAIDALNPEVAVPRGEVAALFELWLDAIDSEDIPTREKAFTAYQVINGKSVVNTEIQADNADNRGAIEQPQRRRLRFRERVH